EPCLLLLEKPAQGVAEKESLERRHAAELLALLVLLGFLKRIKAQEHPAMVGDVLAQTRLSVDVETGQRLISVELLHHDLGSLFEFRGVLVGPPILKVACGVELAAFVVEPMGDFVAYG